jgi:hypothetical protein
MPAYVIVALSVTNEALYAEYAVKVRESNAPFPSRCLPLTIRLRASRRPESNGSSCLYSQPMKKRKPGILPRRIKWLGRSAINRRIPPFSCW